MRAAKAALIAALGVAAFVVAEPSPATELWAAKDGVARLDFSGSLRETLVASQGTRLEDFADGFASDAAACANPATFPNCAAFDELGERAVISSSTRLRTRFDARIAEGIDAAVVYDHEVAAGHLRTLDNFLAASFASKSFIGAEQVIASGAHAAWVHLLYRAFVHFEKGPLELRVGRQRIAWGEGRLWNPIDRLDAIGPLAIEADESPGIDSVDVRWNFSGFDYAQFVYAPAHNHVGARYAARVHLVAFDTDLSLLGGQFEGAPTAGLDVSRNLGGAAIRLEAIWTDPEQQVLRYGAASREEPDPFWQVVASADYNIDVGTGLYVLVEHLYNGNALGFGRGRAGPVLELFQSPGVAQTHDLFATSRVVSFAPHLSGVEFGYDITPELRGDLLTLVDWKGGSAMLFPMLVYSPAGSLELSLGLQAGLGPRRSEFGERGVLGYAIAEWFF